MARHQLRRYQGFRARKKCACTSHAHQQQGVIVDINKIIARAKGVLLTPRAEWAIIAAEPETVGGLFKGYIVVMAAIRRIIGFPSMSVIGESNFLLGSYRMPMATGLEIAVVSYLFSLLGVFVLALIVEVLAPTFGGEETACRPSRPSPTLHRRLGGFDHRHRAGPGHHLGAGGPGLRTLPAESRAALHDEVPAGEIARLYGGFDHRRPSSSTSSSAWRCGRFYSPGLAWVTASAACTRMMAPPRARLRAAPPARHCRTTQASAGCIQQA